MTRGTSVRIFALALLAALATNVLIGDEARGFVDGLIAGFSDGL